LLIVRVKKLSLDGLPHGRGIHSELLRGALEGKATQGHTVHISLTSEDITAKRFSLYKRKFSD
jgi:hypothetical protein